MPKRTDISKVLLIGSGPIVIGQACEFDYSGTQACRALKEEGFDVILLNSNPATIMTDPSIADRTYIEPLNQETLIKIIEIEKPDVLLPTLGGQTALNLALALFESGILDRYNIEMIGADSEAIKKAEDRLIFKNIINDLGLRSPRSVITYSLEEALASVDDIGFPCVVRPAFTLGGTGGGIAYTRDELAYIATGGLQQSLISEILIEESIYGWKEYELEVIRDKKDNVIIVCSIENLDPIGVHTGDSITVAPAQTLSDRQYQMMRTAAIDIIRAIGVETGGSNIQFAMNPKNGELAVIEMNPRVSRSSALASKATGFPIAKVAAKLAIGYTLDELTNDITGTTPASFEPSIDYCVVKVPSFSFKQFPGTPSFLGTSMKSVGEVMAIGRTFKEAFHKAIRSLEGSKYGFRSIKEASDLDLELYVRSPNPLRMSYIFEAFSRGWSIERVNLLSQIDSWFLYQLKYLVDLEVQITSSVDNIKEAKRMGMSDARLAQLLGFKDALSFRQYRKNLGIEPAFALVDSCSAEFPAKTPYYYSTYATETEVQIGDKPRIMILGSGPNRIGQGVEFDYCCVHASYTLKTLGYESVMLNSNPETVSTDFDVSDKLYFEPVTAEDVLNVYEAEKAMGIIVQFGGQTPLNIAKELELAGVRLLGTSQDSIDRAEDRERFRELLSYLGLLQPDSDMASSFDEALSIAESIGYPILVRPSYVLGGASMKIVYNKSDLFSYLQNYVVDVEGIAVLIDDYLEGAKEVDVDALSDGEECVIAGVMEHIEEAGIHSGDSACALPPYSLSQEIIEEIEVATKRLALELNVIGLLNVQFAVKNGRVYVIEVNPRASRSIPFVSKATGVLWPSLATKVILGAKLCDMSITLPKKLYYSVKEVVLPFDRFPNTDILLSPEMKSTGEVMGIDENFYLAFYKAQIASGQQLPLEGRVFLSVADRDKVTMLVKIAKSLLDIGFTILSTKGTRKFLMQEGVIVDEVNKLHEGEDTIIDLLKRGEIQLAFNTPSSPQSLIDEKGIRQTIINKNIPYVTTLAAMIETVRTLEVRKNMKVGVVCLQDYYKEINVSF